MTVSAQLSPMMQQWQDLKNKQPGSLLLFRLGDFYEAFYEDAKILSNELDITLTKRQDIPMSGIPYHSCANYLDILLARGHKIAIAEQVESSNNGKGLVKREIVKIMSPGATSSSNVIDDKKHHFIATACFKNGSFCLAWLDISLNEAHFQFAESVSDVINLLTLISPKELLVSIQARSLLEQVKSHFPSSILYSESFDIKIHEYEFLENLIKDHFQVSSLNALGLNHELAVMAFGKLFHILKKDRLYNLENITQVFSSSNAEYLMIDKATQNHLELFEKKEGKFQHLTLFNYLNHTLTNAGSRLLENWLKFPLLKKDEIINRQNGVAFFKTFEKKLNVLEILKKVKDIQKILSRISLKTAGPQDLKNLQIALECAFALTKLFHNDFPTIINQSLLAINHHPDLANLLNNALLEHPATRLCEGPTFKKGYHTQLDELLFLTQSQDEFLKNYELKLKDETGIKTLKVGSSKNFGFYIEISKGQASHAPPYFVRRQTLTNQERFITEELSIFEKKAQKAKQELSFLEHQIFEELCIKVFEHFKSLSETAGAISLLDVLQGLSTQASKPGYAAPEFSETNELIIEQGRHPIIEDIIGAHQFIPNDLRLHGDPDLFMLITGPNMGGKSTYMRQAAICVILAQIGSYVPASYMRLSPIDKLFTRIGASDDIASGQSTFMVEMGETAYILKNATSSSLVILDEIGRGTSTYDGIAIAYAISNYLLSHPKGLPKTLFATHYFELTSLDNEDKRVVNFHAGVKEDQGKIIFSHQVLKGAADKSYGIQVARLAGLPESVITIATQKLKQLLDPSYIMQKPKMQLDIPAINSSPIAYELSNLNLDNLTPIEALNILSLWKNQYSI